MFIIPIYLFSEIFPGVSRGSICSSCTRAHSPVWPPLFLNTWCIMYSISIFYFTFLLIWGCVRTQCTPLLTGLSKLTSISQSIYWRCPHSMSMKRSGVRPSVRLSVPSVDSSNGDLTGGFAAATYNAILGGSVAEWLACWAQAQKGLGSNRSRDAVG